MPLSFLNLGKRNDIFFMKGLAVRLYSDASWLGRKYLLVGNQMALG